MNTSARAGKAPSASAPEKAIGTAPKTASPRPKATSITKGSAMAPPKPAAARTIHPAIAAAISPVVVLSTCIPHDTVSHRLLEYIVPRFVPARAVDVSVLGTTRASQLLGDLSVTSAEFGAVVTKGTKIRGVLTVSSATHRDLAAIRERFGSYLTSLRLNTAHPFNVVAADRAAKEEDAADPCRSSVAAFAQMAHLRTLSIKGFFSEGSVSGVMACVLAVLPRLRSLSLENTADWKCDDFFRLAAPNRLQTLAIAGPPARVLWPSAEPTFAKPSFELWRFYPSLTSLTMSNAPFGAPFLEGAAAGLTSLQRLALPSARFTPECTAALAAFPEGLTSITLHAEASVVEATLAAYPFLTDIDVRSDDAELSVDCIHAEGSAAAAAFKQRSAHRCDVRERALRAALESPLPPSDAAEGPPSSALSVPPMVADLSSGNRRLCSEAGGLRCLRTTQVNSDGIERLGSHFPALRELKVSFGYHFTIGEHAALSSPWLQLRRLRVLELTGAGVARTEAATVVHPLRVLDAALEDLTLQQFNEGIIIAVATHLPRLARLRFESVEYGRTTTATVRLAALVHAGAVNLPQLHRPLSILRSTASAAIGAAAWEPQPVDAAPQRSSRSASELGLQGRPSTATDKGALEFSLADVGRVATVDTAALFKQPRLLHTFAIRTDVDVAFVPALAVLFPQLSTLQCRGLHHGWQSCTFSTKSLRPYWPYITLKKSAH